MSFEDFLSRFQNVRQCGADAWMAACPAHEDTNASLSIKRGEDGRLVMHCFAGCSFSEILHALGMEPKDAPGFQAKEQAKPQRKAPDWSKWGCTLAQYAQAKGYPTETLKSFGVVDGAYKTKKGTQVPAVVMPYLDERGKRIKTRFRMTMDKNTDLARFLWDGGSCKHLYGLWRQPSDRKYTLLVEGESDCHALWLAGIPALGLPGASMYAPETMDDALGSYGVVYVHLEKDSGGQEVWASLTGEDGNKPSVLLDRLRFFCLPKGVKDPSDLWIQCKGNAEAFRERLREALKRARPAASFRKPGEWEGKARSRQHLKAQDHRADGVRGAADGVRGGRPSADYAGLAMAFYHQCLEREGKSHLRVWRGEWYRWDGRRYEHTDAGDIRAQMAEWMQDDERVAEFHCQASRNAIENAMLNLTVPKMCGIPSRTQMYTWIGTGEAAKGWRAMANVVVDVELAARIQGAWALDGADTPEEVKQAATRDLTPDLFSLLAMDYCYDPTADCPLFRQWLASTLPDPEVQQAVQMMMGLLLVPDTSYNVCFFLAGEGGCGKSTFLQILEGLIGRENVCRVPLLKFDDKFATWRLSEALVNLVGELPTSDPQGRLRYIEGDFKDSVSGGDVHVEKKGKDAYSAPCTARHVFATNSLPVFFDKSEAIWDRLRIIPFEQRFRYTKAEVRDYAEQIVSAELPGVFNFALVGLAMLRQCQRFPEPVACADAKERHRKRCDVEGSYVKTYYAVATADSYAFPLINGYKIFQEWLRSHGMAARSCQTFREALERVFPDVRIEPGDFTPDLVVTGIRPLFPQDISGSGSYSANF